MDKKIILLKSLLARGGGAEKYTWRLARAFKEKNYQVTLLTSGNPTPVDGFEVISCPRSSPFSFRAVEQFDQFCARYKAPCIFGLDRNRFQTHLRASNGVHAAYLEQRSLVESPLKRLGHKLNPLHRTLLQIEKKSFEHPELKTLFANSSMVKQEILRFYKTDPQKIQIIHNGVEWEEMASDFSQWVTEKPKIAARLGLDPHIYHFLFIGHHYKRKGLEQLLRGLSLLPHRLFHLSVIGKEKNQAYFIQLAHTLKLDQSVRFFGARSDIRSFYQLADCLVIPSFYDPFANVTVEALAMGLFVVSSKYNGGHEIMTQGTLIEELQDPGSLCASLEEALKHPKSLESSLQIRQGVKHLDFGTQLTAFVEAVS